MAEAGTGIRHHLRLQLSRHFIRVGFAALAADMASRLFVFFMSWPVQRLAALPDGPELMNWPLASSKALDLAAAVLWGFFALGFAFHVVARFEREDRRAAGLARKAQQKRPA